MPLKGSADSASMQAGAYSSATHDIVGYGEVSSIGRCAESMFAELCAGHSGLAPLRSFDASWYGSGNLYEIDDRVDGDVPYRATEFLLDAVAQALSDADLSDTLDDVPVIVGTGLRELRSAELWARELTALDQSRLHFGTALRERFGATRTYTVSNACSASLYALAMASDLIDTDEADVVVVAGTDAVTESMFGVADRLQSVPPDRLRPFDQKRMGTILGEGASTVVLRRRESTTRQSRGVLRGVSANCDAFHTTAPDIESIAAAMAEAHARAGVGAAEIDLVMLHGTGTYANDLAEASALAKFFGAPDRTPLMTAIKSMTGHTSGASGLHSLITALQAMSAGRVPPTVSLDEPIAELSEQRIVRGQAACDADIRLAQVNGFGFGGVNAVAIVQAPE